MALDEACEYTCLLLSLFLATLVPAPSATRLSLPPLVACPVAVIATIQTQPIIPHRRLHRQETAEPPGAVNGEMHGPKR